MSPHPSNRSFAINLAYELMRPLNRSDDARISPESVDANAVVSPTLIYIHGFGCSRIMWRHVVEGFSRTHRQMLLDLPGHGRHAHRSFDPARHGSLEGMSDFVDACIRDANMANEIILIGHSIGCNIAWRLAAKRPDAVLGLILVNPSPCFENKQNFGGGFDRSAIEEILELMERNPKIWAETLSGLVGSDNARLRSWLADSFCSLHPLCLRLFSRATFLVDDREQLDRISHPTLIISNARDSLAPPSVHDFMMARIKHATGCVLDVAGHAAHISHPFLVREAIETFLSGLNSAARPTHGGPNTRDRP